MLRPLLHTQKNTLKLTGEPSKFDPARFAEEVKQRIRESREQRLKTRQDVALGRPLEAEEN